MKKTAHWLYLEGKDYLKYEKEEERCIRFLDGKGFVHQLEFLHGKGESCDACRWDPICAGMYSMACTFDERELSPVFADPLPVLRAVLGREPDPALVERIQTRRGRRSTSEQPSPEQRREMSARPPFTRSGPFN